MRDPERIYTPKRDETEGLGLFAPVPSAAMPGAGHLARAEARERSRHGSEDAYRLIAQSLEGHGPQTRKELAASTGLNVNTINGRVAELREPEAPADWRVYTEGRRNGESIVHLHRLRHP